jgi:hypothetical protein
VDSRLTIWRTDTMRIQHGVTAVLSGLFLLGLFVPAVQAADLPADAAKLFGEEFIPADGIGFVSIRVQEILGVKWVDAFQKKLGPVGNSLDESLNKVFFTGKLTNIERILLVVVDPENEPVTIVTTIKGFDRKALMERVKKEEFKEERVGKQTIYNDGGAFVLESYCVMDDSTLMHGPTESVKKCLTSLADKKTSGPLLEVLKQLDATAQVALAVNPARIPLPDNLPPEFRPLQPLSKAKWIALEGSLTDGVKLGIKVNCDKEKDVADMQKALEAGQTMLAGFLAGILKQKGVREDTPSTAKLMDQVLATLKSARIEAKGQLVQANLQIKVDSELLATAMDEAAATIKLAAARAKSTNNLRQIAIAMLSMESNDGVLPTSAIYSKAGKPLLSWRVAILPYIEQNTLYEQFKLDEPWDSEHNKKLLDKMPNVYAPTTGDLKDRTKTYYKVFVGKSAAFEENTPLKIAAFTDGLSNTILAIEAGDPVPWTKPDDIPFDLKKPLPKLAGPFKGFTLAVFADGHAMSIPATADPKKLLGSITRDQGDDCLDDTTPPDDSPKKTVPKSSGTGVPDKVKPPQR